MAAILRAVFLALGCALFLYLLVRLDTAQIFALLLQMRWSLAAIAAVYFLHQLIRTAALWGCVTTFEPFPYWQLVRIRLSGEAIQFLTFTGPFLAEPAKALLLREQGLRTKSAVAAVMCEYLIYMMASAAMAAAALPYMLRHYEVPPAFATGARVAFYAAAGFLAAAFVAIALRIYLIGAILNSARRVPGLRKYVRVDPQALRSTEHLLFTVLRHPRFLAILAVEFAAQVPLMLELYILLTAAGQTFSWVQPLLIEASTKFLSLAAFFVPGQIGASEGLYAVVFDAIGLTATVGFSLALARRLRSFLTAGAGLLFLWLHGRRRKLQL